MILVVYVVLFLYIQTGAALSSPLVTMGISLIACNLGLLPATNAAYTTVNKYLVPLAIPLLLLDADLKKVMISSTTVDRVIIALRQVAASTEKNRDGEFHNIS